MARTLAQIQAEIDGLTATAHRYQAGLNEGEDGFNPYSAQLRALHAEYDQVAEATADARVDAVLAEQDALWTVELTRQRRAEWNAWVQSQGATIAPSTVATRIREQGWRIEELQRAITRHAL